MTLLKRKPSLQPPPEPVDIREALSELAKTSGPAPYIVFAGNRLAKYLWDHWKNQLKQMGLTWRDLLRAMSRTVNKALAWITGEASWQEYVEAIAETLEASSREGVPGTATARKRTLLDYMR